MTTELWVFILKRSPLSDYLIKLFGEDLHEKLIMFAKVGYWPNLSNPKSFNEKICHRKLRTTDPEYGDLADKYLVREYVRDTVNGDILTDLYYHTKSPQEIPFENLPSEFVIKANHGSGWNRIVKNKDSTNYNKITEECAEWLKQDYGQSGREYWYQDITPRIIIEELIRGENGEIPKDYKFFVFNGDAKYVQVDSDRSANHKRRFYSTDWEPQPFRLDYPIAPVIESPPDLERMAQIAESLGENFEFVRVDLYNPSPGEVVFGELTFAPGSGQERFIPKEWDFRLGSEWKCK